ncbi:DNA-directed RNA polymerase subunit B, partial [Candidatus Woesearchaeota archaeon]
MENQEKILIENFFKENSIVMSNIESFNNFIDEELNNIIEENKEVVPTIIPPNMESLKLRLDKIWVTKPEITEADGSKRNIFPVEARLRKVTYAAPIFIEISSHVDGVQKETFTTQIGSLPIMLKSKNCLLHGLNREE